MKTNIRYKILANIDPLGQFGWSISVFTAVSEEGWHNESTTYFSYIFNIPMLKVSRVSW